MAGAKKKQFRFSANDDIILLREVLANDPYSSAEPGKKWDEIADATELQGLSGRRCRERTSLLLTYYKKEDAEALKRSGTEEEVEEKHQLLQEIKELQEEQVSRLESENKKKEKQRKNRSGDKKGGFGNIALETYSCWSSDRFAPLNGPSSCGRNG
ncbi:uncharacterized protein LOC119733890 [Patiria miniata]|uniref:Myb-like domain-containing protein n=1 Tax=Patiria miniata TaxID=46514 RepID=A0A914AI14_PATMI|nr:uncharacterized protein LOC119733890 [Patiria miniata]